MNIWRLSTMNLQELIQRLRAGESRAAISQAMHMSVNTVKDYRRWAEVQELLTGPLPDLARLEALRHETYHPGRQRHPTVSTVEGYRAEVAELLAEGYKPLIIWKLLNQRHTDFGGSHSAIWRLVRSIQGQQPREVVGRIETEPGAVAQVDFGYVGYLRDPQTLTPRKAWVFDMLLGWSRHMYAEIVFDQKITTWLRCHQRAFEYFGGVPQRIVLDNLKAAIIKAYVLDQDVEVQRAYRECALHYEFLIDPCLPRKPQHKGKVERGGVSYLKQSFVPLLTDDDTLTTANHKLRQWLTATAGLRKHGTTREAPLARFDRTERADLQPLPQSTYQPSEWKQSKVHRDCHVTFEKSYYSVPHRLVGQTVWLAAGLQGIRLFSGTDHTLLACHPRAAQPGQRFTHPDHLPPHLAEALSLSRQTCQARAETFGPATSQVVAELLASRPIDRFRTAVRLLHLANEYTPARLEAACAFGLAQGDSHYPTLKRLLRDGLDRPPLAATPAAPPEQFTFARPTDELAEAILGGAAWN